MPTSPPEIYPLARDEAETTRLNDQHRCLVDIAGGLIDSTVPLENVSAVADVGTGSGIWLLEARDLLNERTANRARYYHGFDISAAQFPAPSARQQHGMNMNFSVHDILRPFPVEHHNRYDLVHVRMLVAALVESKYREAVANLLTILKPGGYLQWVELDSSALHGSPSARDPRSARPVHAWLEFLDGNGLSQCPPRTIQDACKEVGGLVNVSARSVKVRGCEELGTERTQRWQLQAWAAVLPQVFLRTGAVSDRVAADVCAGEAIDGLKSYFADGEVVDLAFGVVVGQRRMG
ncbi:class I SAM-dependent methyltransferase [Aspergillus lucknowensis]|uniref:Methyltransferase domain-containing protein n=1 Tax=Aspergillus lucknowensis TaxID=176173 RepID=A0ABR4LKM6_9EURO